MEIQDINFSNEELVKALADISHDLRSPLGTILGFTELMVITDDAHERAEYNQLVQETGMRMLSLISQILNLSDPKTQKREIVLADFDIDKTLCSVFKLYHAQLEAKGLPLSYLSHGRGRTVHSSEAIVREILDNYLSNAKKYAKHGDVTICYDDIKGDGVCIHVIDTGVGMSEKDRSRVFNRYEMLNKEGTGHGLGLNICRQLANSLGGEVGVSAEPGKGCDFWLFLPDK